MTLLGVGNDGGWLLCWGRARLLVGVMRLDSWAALSIAPGAWSVSCAGWRSFGLIEGVPCVFRSSAVPGVWSLYIRVTLGNDMFMVPV